MDVLLVNPREEDSRFEKMIPLGLAWIAAVLEKNGVQVRIADLEVKNENIEYFLNKYQPKIVGISGTSHTRFESFEIAEAIKKVDESIITVYGGVHATFTADDTLRHIKDIDIVLRGEGETSFLTLVKTLIRREKRDIENLPGISYRKNGNIIHNPPSPRIRDLDSLPMPAYHLFNMEKYIFNMEHLNIPGTSIMTSRGCPINCVFCSASAMWGKTYTRRSPENVINEIKFLIDKYKIRGIKFFDSTLTLNRNHILGLCDEIIKHGMMLPWECEIRADSVDLYILKRMKEAGCYYVDLGVESASPRVLKEINKKITIEQVERVIDWCYKLGLKLKVFLMMGLPGETLEDAMETIKFIKTFRDKISDTPKVVLTAIYPGTPLEYFAKSRGYLPPNFSWSKSFDQEVYKYLDYVTKPPKMIPVLIQPQFGVKEIGKIQYEMDRINKYLSPGFIFKKISSIRSAEDIKRCFKYAYTVFNWQRRI